MPPCGAAYRYRSAHGLSIAPVVCMYHVAATSLHGLRFTACTVASANMGVVACNASTRSMRSTALSARCAMIRWRHSQQCPQDVSYAPALSGMGMPQKVHAGCGLRCANHRVKVVEYMFPVARRYRVYTRQHTEEHTRKQTSQCMLPQRAGRQQARMYTTDRDAGFRTDAHHRRSPRIRTATP